MGNTISTGWDFTQIPIWAVCDHDLGDGAKVLLTYLKWRQGNDAACWPTKATMAHDLGVSKPTIERRLRELEEHGYILREFRSGRSTLYHIIADPQGKKETFQSLTQERQHQKASAPSPKSDEGKEATPIKNDAPPSPKSDAPPPLKNDAHDDNHERESCNDKKISASGDAEPPTCFPELFDTSIDDIREMQFTRSQWEKILGAEKARGDGPRGHRTRVTLVQWLEKKLNGSHHPAIQIFHEEMQIYPRTRQMPIVIDIVGEDQLDFWREVVRTWMLRDYNPLNLKGMLEWYEQGRIPSLKDNGNGSKQHSHRRWSREDLKQPSKVTGPLADVINGDVPLDEYLGSMDENG